MKKLNLIFTALGVVCFTFLSASGFCATPGKKLNDALDKEKFKYKKFKNMGKDKYNGAVEKGREKLDKAKANIKNKIKDTKEKARSKAVKTQDNRQKEVNNART
ncbi:Uncharacterized protein NEOC65_001551 [Neochlamydia sp. AcF65]|uniref:hypothetical protein n=1 Tax=Neochlamydia sp. AcF65 TaxID=2795735 RepID=UPI001BC94522|nr:hypothetical protein [Neochlamydia sp. AcF65]MBS4166463.1 Uncharacterized protein [Neochlamydia sp. AcF65]